MAIYKTQGTVHQTDEVETFQSRNGQTYRKQSIVLEETDDRGRTDYIQLRAFGEAVEETEDLRPGETVSVTFAISAREYNGRFYNDLNIIHVRRTAPVQEQQEQKPSVRERARAIREKAQAVLDGTVSGEGQDDDLPF